MGLGLAGKNVIITGGSSNIGRAIVHAFAAESSNIAIAELVPQQGEKVAAEVAGMNTGSRVRVIPTDVTYPQQVDAMVARVINEFGHIDVLVNNVGWTIDRLFLDKPREEYEKEVQVNLWGAINCIHAVLPHMIERQSGAIVSISSDAGRMGEYREAVYSACKAGVTALSKAIDCLISIMNDLGCPASARVSAARVVLEMAHKAIETDVLESRIESLEGQIAHLRIAAGDYGKSNLRALR